MSRVNNRADGLAGYYDANGDFVQIVGGIGGNIDAGNLSTTPLAGAKANGDFMTHIWKVALTAGTKVGGTVPASVSPSQRKVWLRAGVIEAKPVKKAPAKK